MEISGTDHIASLGDRCVRERCGLTLIPRVNLGGEPQPLHPTAGGCAAPCVRTAARSCSVDRGSGTACGPSPYDWPHRLCGTNCVSAPCDGTLGLRRPTPWPCRRRPWLLEKRRSEQVPSTLESFRCPFQRRRRRPTLLETLFSQQLPTALASLIRAQIGLRCRRPQPPEKDRSQLLYTTVAGLRHTPLRPRRRRPRLPEKDRSQLLYTSLARLCHTPQARARFGPGATDCEQTVVAPNASPSFNTWVGACGGGGASGAIAA